MSVVAYATMPVIPEVKNLRATLERQTAGQFAAVGRRGGQQMGDAAGREAGSRIKGRLTPILREAFAPVVGIVAGAGIVEFFRGAIDQAREAAASTRQTAAVLKSTGDIANVSAKDVDELADSLARKVGIDAEAIHSGENLLLTFRNIRNEAGAGNDIFDQTTAAVLNISTALKRDLASTSIQVGKALNDPVRGLAALTRIGITFSAQQRQQIKTLVDSGHALDAQKLILKELSSEFQGSAAAGHDSVDRLGVAFKKLERDAGTAALPAIGGLANGLNAAIPTIEATGGVVGDVAHDFGRLPGPIKAATGALVAFKLAQAAGLTGRVAAGAASLASGLETIRIRAMLAADEYRALRTVTLEETAAAHVFSPAVGRMSASLGALRAGAVGAGAGLRSGLSRASALVGGPWGAAFIAGTAIVAHFWLEHQKAKQRVQDFTATLDKETGALTENSREFVAKQLLDDGVLKSAQRLGLALPLVTNAALGQWKAIATLNAIMAAKGPLDDQAAADAIKVKQAIDAENGVVGQGVANQRLFAAALGLTGAAAGEAASATGHVVTATSTYTSELDRAKTAIRGLLDIENKRRNALLGRKQDQLALAEALTAARKEAADGARTLDLSTEAGQKNRRALFDLAEQWNNSAHKVRNAKGAYAEMRQNFIDVAEKMGATKTQAQKLADKILDIPRRSATEITTPGMREALKNLRELRAEMAAIHNFKGERIVFSAQAAKNRLPRQAGGGLLNGPGTGTSDSILMWGSTGEFMQRKAAVDYYGVGFMQRLNALQVPRYAGGGLVGGVQTASSPELAGQEIVGVLRLAADGTALIDGVVRRGINAGEARDLRRRRLAGLGGGVPAR